jgi:hypothetical protein
MASGPDKAFHGTKSLVICSRTVDQLVHMSSIVGPCFGPAISLWCCTVVKALSDDLPKIYVGRVEEHSDVY